MKKTITMLVAMNSANGASANRLKAIAKGFAANGIDIHIYGISNAATEKSFLYDGVFFKNLSLTNNRFIAYVTGMLRYPFVIRKSDYLWFESVKKALLWDWWFLFKRKKAIVVHEKTECPDIFQNEFKKKIYLKNCKKLDRIFVISTSLKEYFIDKGIDSDKIIIYPMLIDPNRFSDCIEKIYNFPYFAYCGYMGNNKDGLYNLIDAFELFSKCDGEHKLVLIGDAKPDEFAKIKQYVFDKNLSDRVIFTGRISADKVPNYLSNAKALLLARPNNIQAKYGFPTKLGEYLATGKPIIVTDTSDIAKYLKDGKDAYVVEPDNVKVFADKMLYVVQNYDEAKKVGEKGKEKIYSDFNYIVQSKELIDKIGL